ncbi:MAG: hypothetical protein D6768_06705 [Chloroflexi bacterium]|nr:MAG: hypothetical protein D6768_06705 [Chloroflexota bacterium]
MPKIACFVTPHGYGHAARAAAVMSALHELTPDVQFEIFTRVPDWFFAESVAAPFNYHPVLTDLGLVQRNSLREDIPATLRALADFLPFDPALVEQLAGQLTKSGCGLVLCDISPLGIAVARAAGLPSVLVENFTWDWIYEGYASANGQFQPHIEYLREMFNAAGTRIQTEPVTHRVPTDLTTGPVSRAVRQPAAQVRAQLGVAPAEALVVLTMGGAGWSHRNLSQLAQFEGAVFAIAGSGSAAIQREGNLITLPHAAGIFHPDLINAANAVIGKVGYSTLAEVYQAGVPFGFVARPRFRESGPLVAFVRANMSGLEIGEAEMASGEWLTAVPRLLALPRAERPASGGAAQIARFILNRWGRAADF